MPSKLRGIPQLATTWKARKRRNIYKTKNHFKTFLLSAFSMCIMCGFYLIGSQAPCCPSPRLGKLGRCRERYCQWSPRVCPCHSWCRRKASPGPQLLPRAPSSAAAKLRLKMSQSKDGQPIPTAHSHTPQDAISYTGSEFKLF